MLPKARAASITSTFFDAFSALKSWRKPPGGVSGQSVSVLAQLYEACDGTLSHLQRS